MTKKLETVQQAMLKADALAKKGDTVQAARLYQGILARFPQNKRAARALQTLQSRPAQKRTGATPSQPTSAEIGTVVAQLSAQNFARAIALGRALQRQYPNAADIPNLIGAAHAQTGDLEAAVASIQQAIRLRPNFVEAYCNLGNALYELERTAPAIAAYSQSIKLRPDYAKAITYRARALLDANRFDEAITDCRAALALDAANTDAKVTLGNAYIGAGQSQRSLACFDEILARQPDWPKALAGKGNALKTLGRLDEAISCMSAALAIDPMQTGTHMLLSSVKKFTPDDPQIAQLDAAIATDMVKPRSRAQLHFARAKASHDLGNFDQAFDHYDAGNRLQNTALHYDGLRDRQLFATIKGYFADPLPPALDISAPRHHAPARPIFIVGMPRSGTTLVEQILASHSDVFGAGELAALGRLVPSTVDFSDPGRFALESTQMLGRIRRQYFDAIDALDVGQPVFTDKLPLNFRWLGFMLLAFPEARVIHLRRDPMAVCWSNYQQLFAGDANAFAYDLADLGNYYRLYLDLMAFWRQKFPDRIYDLEYEALTRDQSAHSRSLLAHCGLDWQDAVLDFHKTKRPVATASAAQVRRKMYQGSSQAWRNYERHLHPLDRALAGDPAGQVE